MDTQPTDEQPIDLSGRTLGPYSLKTRIGVGGTATVYRAEDDQTHAEVAIKVLHRGADRTTVLRFQKEISLARALCEQSNRHLATIVMDGQDHGLYWVAMELMRGKTVREILAAAPKSGLRWEAAAFIVMNICGAVASMHELEVVHRDLKPENVFLSRTATGQLWVTLLDLGIAKEFSAEPKTQEGVHLTDRNELPGTGPYIAPERVLGGPCTPATDQYSLGVLLYECLHRQLPYPPSANYTSLTLQIHGSLADLSWKKIPDELKQIVLRAMSKTCEERFPDVLEMGRALHRVLDSAREWVDGKAAAMELVEPTADATLSRPVERPLDEKTTDASFSKLHAPDSPRPPGSDTKEVPPFNGPVETHCPDAQNRAPAQAPTGARVRVGNPRPAEANTRAKAQDPAEIQTHESRQTGPNPSTASGSTATAAAAVEETVEESPRSHLLVRHGPRIYRFLGTTLRVTMMALAAMMALAGDPQWTQLQRALTDSTKGETGTIMANSTAPAPAPAAPAAPAVPAVPAAPAVAPATSTDGRRDPPPDSEQDRPEVPSVSRPNTASGSKVTTGKRDKRNDVSNSGTKATGKEDVSDTEDTVLLTVTSSEQKRRRNQATNVAQARVGEICRLAADSTPAKGQVCVEFMISATGKLQSASLGTLEPAGLTFVDKQGAGCVLRVAKEHIDLKQISPVPSTFKHCFTVKL